MFALTSSISCMSLFGWYHTRLVLGGNPHNELRRWGSLTILIIWRRDWGPERSSVSPKVPEQQWDYSCFSGRLVQCQALALKHHPYLWLRNNNKRWSFSRCCWSFGSTWRSSSWRRTRRWGRNRSRSSPGTLPRMEGHPEFPNIHWCSSGWGRRHWWVPLLTSRP